ncbi:hypothetical protein J6590_003338 [Homalodisca vitripennis]|nr:hypothetical protein J6590_003338 [Homalodisca vitripennis]
MIIENNINVKFTFFVVQRLEFDAATDLTPGIWSHVRLVEIQKESTTNRVSDFNLKCHSDSRSCTKRKVNWRNIGSTFPTIDEQFDIVTQFIEDPQQSTRSVVNLCYVSLGSVVRLIKKNKFHSYKIPFVHELNEDDPDRRLQFRWCPSTCSPCFTAFPGKLRGQWIGRRGSIESAAQSSNLTPMNFFYGITLRLEPNTTSYFSKRERRVEKYACLNAK